MKLRSRETVNSIMPPHKSHAAKVGLAVEKSRLSTATASARKNGGAMNSAKMSIASDFRRILNFSHSL